MQGWIHSPPHQKNLVEPAVIETGVGVARSANGSYFAVQLFGRPKAKAITLVVSNKGVDAVQYTLGEETFDLPVRATRTHTLPKPMTVTFPSIETNGEPSSFQIEKNATYNVTGKGAAMRVTGR